MIVKVLLVLPPCWYCVRESFLGPQYGPLSVAVHVSPCFNFTTEVQSNLIHTDLFYTEMYEIDRKKSVTN